MFFSVLDNLNDGMIWGLLPILLLSRGFNSEWIGIIAAVYPAVWGISQLYTGRMADIKSNKAILFWGMMLQGLAIITLVHGTNGLSFILICIILGIGTALVYPTFLVVIAKNSTPVQRAESIGVFRLWRDLGYAIGALMSGIIADLFGLEYAILVIGILTLCSAIVIQVRMDKDKLINN